MTTDNQQLINQAFDAANFDSKLRDFILPFIQLEALTAELTPHGKASKGLKTNAPKACHIKKYIWRMARFNAGIDVTLPVMVNLMLDVPFKPFLKPTRDSNGYFIPQNYNDNQATMKTIATLLDAVSMLLVKELGYDAFSGAKAWGRLI